MTLRHGEGAFSQSALTGHINPTLGLVRELAARGDEVIYYATQPFAARVAGANAFFRPYRNRVVTDLPPFSEHLDDISWLLTRTTSEILEQELEDFRAERPDYLITDSVAPWGQWVGEILGVPVVTSVSTFAFNRHVLRYAAGQGVRPKGASHIVSKLRFIAKSLLLMLQMQRRYGVRGPGFGGLGMGRSKLNIVYTSRYFQPCGDTFDDRFRFIGPSITDRSEASDFPWQNITSNKILYISLGTLFNTDISFYRNCLKAFSDMDCQVILSIGANVRASELGVIPANFTLRAHVPQMEILHRASVFVTHAGMNSVIESLSCGVPMVAIPQMGEQKTVASRVDELGAGLRLNKSEATPANLRSQVERVLSDSGFREAAATIRSSFATAGGVSAGADAIWSFTGRNPG